MQESILSRPARPTTTASHAGDSAVTRVERLLTAAGIRWTCTNANGSIAVPATVPGVAHQALRNAGILPGDPLYRYNELDFGWVTRENWTFSA